MEGKTNASVADGASRSERSPVRDLLSSTSTVANPFDPLRSLASSALSLASEEEEKKTHNRRPPQIARQSKVTQRRDEQHNQREVVVSPGTDGTEVTDDGEEEGGAGEEGEAGP
jgi:hypothetical protein